MTCPLPSCTVTVVLLLSWFQLEIGPQFLCMARTFVKIPVEDEAMRTILIQSIYRVCEQIVM